MWRQFGFFITGAKVDGLIAWMLIVISFIYLHSSSLGGQTLHILGKHSFNIFLFHTFIYYYYFPDLFYNTKHSIFAVVPLLLVCLVVSFGLEKVKSCIKFYSFEKWIIEFWGVNRKTS